MFYSDLGPGDMTGREMLRGTANLPTRILHGHTHGTPFLSFPFFLVPGEIMAYGYERRGPSSSEMRDVLALALLLTRATLHLNERAYGSIQIRRGLVFKCTLFSNA